VAAAVADRDVRAKFQLQGAEPVSLSLEETKKFVADESKKYHDIIVKSGMPQIE
jgi:tripartite-type tricarboxylate transporter receptor subunit TctC